MKSIRGLFTTKSLAIVAVVSLWAAAAGAASLDGTQWRVEITPEGSTIPHHVDRIRFEGGKVTSVVFERKGFPSVPYTGSAASWSADQTGAEGELSWKASIEGEALKGTMIWKQADGKVLNHTLAGMLFKEGQPVTEGGTPIPETAPTPETAATEPTGVPSSTTTPSTPSAKPKKGFGCTLIR